MADDKTRVESPTRTRIVDAAVEALAVGDPARLRRSLTIDEVAAHAGLARRTLYTYFETIDELIQATIETLEQAPADLDRDGVEEAASALATHYNVRQWRARRACASMLGIELTTGLGYGPAPAHILATRLASALEAAGRRPYPPLDPDRLADLFAGTAETAVVAGLNSGETGRVLLNLAGSLTFHDLSEYRQNPGQALIDESVRRTALEEAGSEFPILVHTVTDAALSAFDALGYADAHIEDVAQRSGMSMALIESLFGRKSDIARRLVGDLAVSVAGRIGSAGVSPDLPTAATQAIVSIATIADEHPSVIELLMAIDPVTRSPFGREVLAGVVRVMARRPDDDSAELVDRLLPVLWVTPILAQLPADKREGQAESAVSIIFRDR